MVVLVTGGAGFIGSHLCERLLEKGHEVRCLDDFSTGSERNIAHLLDHPRFELLRHDIIQPIPIEADRIYHLACPASPVQYQLNPIRTVKTNVMGTIHMLGAAKKLKARFLLASTSEVYGDPLVHPQPETYWGHVDPMGIRACYDEGKRVSETLTMDYHRQHGVDIRIARIFNTYGPRLAEDDGRVVSNFILQALKHRDITIFGDGTQSRCFCYVDDMVSGLISLMECEDGTPDARFRPVNLGSDAEVSMQGLAEMIRALTGSRSRLVRRPAPEGDPRRRQPDLRVARELLGWKPETDLEDGLQRTIRYFRDLPESGSPTEPEPR